MRAVLLASLLLASGVASSVASAQAGSDAVQDLPLAQGVHSVLAYSSIEYSFVPRQPGVLPWTIRIDADLTGTFKAQGATAATPIKVSSATMTRLSAGDVAVQKGKCETKEKHIAQTGSKTLSYALGPSLATCTFNYSDDAALNKVAATFGAIAETLRLGDKITHDRRFDHLGLNDDLEILTREAKSGDALEIQNIAPLLRSLVANDDLMDVVRRRAQSLLQDASLGVADAADSPR